MPKNYVINSKMLSTSQIEKVISDANKKIDKIGEMIYSEKKKIENDSILYSIIVSAKKKNKYWKTEYSRFDKQFKANDTCIKCKRFEKYCPVHNIIVNDKPSWNGKCVACLKCIKICPNQSIQYGTSTEGISRYLNPAIDLDEVK
jgi:Pyruvate/2-oxoacid:ferredoxin oxidoreductase delta subunit